ncbi:toll/interleukin-1 receptor domain-containing protein [Candidatus Thiosymbion oneisti]|uniref:toll/interleukin-1 receptor domain-containing protein n=1 Tax=Candidatus Thiosymbion oneisti TaxID=589554 RepID=UPI00105E4D1E|nr:toll/interleukin-1 receptor domain-containing protein [Candidatus Thiosymbion oneisti]
MSQATVFISYRRCEDDAKILNRLKTFFVPLEQEGLICGWTDRDIEGGQYWGKEIDAALERAKIGVLLISSDFLASEFTRRGRGSARLDPPHVCG